MDILNLHFNGPYSFDDNEKSVFKCKYANKPCIYLWTIKQNRTNTHHIHYVGETSNLAERQRVHLINILGFNYGIWNIDKAREGISELLWTGLWRIKDRSEISNVYEQYAKINMSVISYLKGISIFVAETNEDNDLRKRIEGCIGWNLRKNHPNEKVLFPGDNHIEKKAETIGVLMISSDEPILGLDHEIKY